MTPKRKFKNFKGMADAIRLMLENPDAGDLLDTLAYARILFVCEETDLSLGPVGCEEFNAIDLPHRLLLGDMALAWLIDAGAWPEEFPKTALYATWKSNQPG